VRWDVIEVRSRATATTAAAFLDNVVARMPFTVRAIQVDAVRSSTPPSKPGVSAAAFTCSCCRRARPSSTARSSAQRTHTEELYELRPFDSFTVEGSQP
jgi:hypothetical protein